MEQLPKIVRERLAVTPKAEVHPDPDLLAAFAEDPLGAREREGVLAHLAHCADCREVLSLAQAEQEVQLPALAAMAAPAQRISRSAWLSGSMLRWGALAACVVVAVSSVVLLRQEKRANSPVTVASKQPAAEPQSLETRQIAKAEPPANEMKSAKADIKKESANERKDNEMLLDRGTEARLRELPPTASPRLTAPGGAVGGVISKQQESSMRAFTLGRAMPAAPAPPPAVPSPQSSVAVNGLAAPAQRSVAFAQALRGAITGKVTDPSGAVVAGAKVTVKNVSTSIERTIATSRDGSYSVPDLPVGTYTVTVSSPGFRTEVTNGVVVDGILQARNLAHTVEVGSSSETVEVAAAVPVSSPTDLPLQGRNMIEMSQAQSQGQKAEAGKGPPVAADLAKAKSINGAARRRPAASGSVTAVTASGSAQTMNAQAGDATRGLSTGYQSDDKSLLRVAGFASRWTISPQGKLQRSVDQGKTWLDVPVAGHTKFRAVSVLGLEIWVGGDAGLLYHSSDGGVIWAQVKPTYKGNSLSSDIVRVDFPDAQHGELTTADQQVWMTSDAGLNWQKQ